MSYETVRVETLGSVGLVTLDRPAARNALSRQLIAELNAALDGFEADPAIGAIVLTGSDKAFAAGADIAEMKGLGLVDVFENDFVAAWERLAAVRKPVVAAVAGYALGGGCELALMCDLVIAAETARFGQPELSLALIPGAGATQRLAKSVGKAKTMDMVLTGRLIDAAEAERIGLVSRVVPAAALRDTALAVGAKIAALSRPAALMAKEAVNRAFESGLADGIRYERRLFQALFATRDKEEGLAAFLEKRPPRFENR
ncbi:enoyl-CoA hydratase [Prosthecomicrobium pneumaticum]|uniref:enoyl-CoA hydratase n=1 Tax=Prosthecomicrobium pneumaticum TaxID=81895 RepID=A0A7W9FM73_9HYPH|nr:enoyl-CoA hydratase [Prosthecomicrobium pneumaticum]MBB5753252.1 enoyl-CoA hydratase [Prosthecomicrobium pneumaticum]